MALLPPLRPGLMQIPHVVSSVQQVVQNVKKKWFDVTLDKKKKILFIIRTPDNFMASIIRETSTRSHYAVCQLIKSI